MFGDIIGQVYRKVKSIRCWVLDVLHVIDNIMRVWVGGGGLDQDKCESFPGTGESIGQPWEVG